MTVDVANVRAKCERLCTLRFHRRGQGSTPCARMGKKGGRGQAQGAAATARHWQLLYMRGYVRVCMCQAAGQ